MFYILASKDLEHNLQLRLQECTKIYTNKNTSFKFCRYVAEITIVTRSTSFK